MIALLIIILAFDFLNCILLKSIFFGVIIGLFKMIYIILLREYIERA